MGVRQSGFITRPPAVTPSEWKRLERSLLATQKIAAAIGDRTGNELATIISAELEEMLSNVRASWE